MGESTSCVKCFECSEEQKSTIQKLVHLPFIIFQEPAFHFSCVVVYCRLYYFYCLSCYCNRKMSLVGSVKYLFNVDSIHLNNTDYNENLAVTTKKKVILLLLQELKPNPRTYQAQSCTVVLVFFRVFSGQEFFFLFIELHLCK